MGSMTKDEINVPLLFNEVKKLQQQLERVTKRRNEIDDEAFKYAEQVEQLQQQNETLQASLDNCLQQNQDMLEMLKELTIIARNDEWTAIADRADALITKIEKGE